MARLSVAIALILIIGFSSQPAFAATTLANGIRVFELPPANDRFELVIGYQSGIRDETGFSGLAEVVSGLLTSTKSCRAIELAAYAAGGEVEFFHELDRTALRVSVPNWARPMILDQTALYLSETPDRSPDLMERARIAATQRATERGSQFRFKIEDEVRLALLGSHPYHHPIEGWKTDLERISADDITRFFAESYGTDRAFVLMSSPVPDEVVRKLAAIPRRISRKNPESIIRTAGAERLFHFASDEPAGAVIFASPVPGVFYRAWYAVLMLDGLARRSVPGKPVTFFRPSLDPYYWSLTVAVPAGQFAETMETTVLQEMNRLQLSRAKPEDLETARKEAREYLESGYVRQWFASHGLEERMKEGLQWISTFTADDMRSAARDVLTMNRVLASWSPKVKRTTVEVEPLETTSASSQTDKANAVSTPLASLTVAAFPTHAHAARSFSTPERLPSGVWIAQSSAYAVFLSGAETAGLPDGPRRDGANGSIWSFDHEPDANAIRAFQKYRADRILVLAPAVSLDRARTLWSAFKGNDRDTTTVAPKGNIANIDLPALLLLKAALDRKLIEAGWWHQASIRIDAAVGATLEIEALPEIRSVIVGWIRTIAAAPPAESDVSWAREVAIHQIGNVLPDVQSLLWQRVPDYSLQELDSIAGTHLQNVAKLYF